MLAHQVGGDAVQPRPRRLSQRLIETPPLERLEEGLGSQLVSEPCSEPAGEVAAYGREVPIEDDDELMRLVARATQGGGVCLIDVHCPFMGGLPK